MIRGVRLTRVYPWEEAEASRFILTGKIPKMPAVVGRLSASRDPSYTYGTITLTVQPWVPAKVIYRFYRDMRQGAFAGRHRSVSERKIVVFRFVVSQYEFALQNTESPCIGSSILQWAQYCAYRIRLERSCAGNRSW